MQYSNLKQKRTNPHNMTPQHNPIDPSNLLLSDINESQAQSIAERILNQTIAESQEQLDTELQETAEKTELPKNVAESKTKLLYLSPKWMRSTTKIGRTGHVRIYDIRLTRTDQVATAFGVHLARAIKSLGNGRTFAPWGELLCEVIKLVILHLSNDVKGSDGVDHEGKNISIKSLTALGLKLQQSGFTGKGRTCTHDDLVQSIAEDEFHVSVDITKLHCIRVTCMPKDLVMKWVEEGLLTASGIGTSTELQGLVEHTAQSGSHEELSIDDLDPTLAERNKKAFDLWLKEQIDHQKPFTHAHFKTAPTPTEPTLVQTSLKIINQ